VLRFSIHCFWLSMRLRTISGRQISPALVKTGGTRFSPRCCAPSHSIYYEVERSRGFHSSFLGVCISLLLTKRYKTQTGPSPQMHPTSNPLHKPSHNSRRATHLPHANNPTGNRTQHPDQESTVHLTRHSRDAFRSVAVATVPVETMGGYCELRSASLVIPVFGRRERQTNACSATLYVLYTHTRK
jgi:hypothetical protein